MITEEQLKYQQAVNRQKWDQAPGRVVLIERLPHCYRLTCADGRTLHMDNEWGLKNYPIVACGL